MKRAADVNSETIRHVLFPSFDGGSVSVQMMDLFFRCSREKLGIAHAELVRRRLLRLCAPSSVDAGPADFALRASTSWGRRFASSDSAMCSVGVSTMASRAAKVRVRRASRAPGRFLPDGTPAVLEHQSASSVGNREFWLLTSRLMSVVQFSCCIRAARRVRRESARPSASSRAVPSFPCTDA